MSLFEYGRVTLSGEFSVTDLIVQLGKMSKLITAGCSQNAAAFKSNV